MSGSSLDGIDLAYCSFDYDLNTISPDNPILAWQLLESTSIPISESWKDRLKALPSASAKELAIANIQLGNYLGDIIHQFIAQHQLEPDFIASHGHTIFHFPELGVTTQIGAGSCIASKTGIPVIDQFRLMDMAYGGQGAPLAPMADKLLFEGFDFFLNLGGIANISCNVNGRFIAFDIGGANQVFNALANEIGLPFDEDGKLGASGNLLSPLLEKANQLPFFTVDYPKSLGNDWVLDQLIPIFSDKNFAVKDRLHTAYHHLAQQITLAIERIIQQESWGKAQFKMLVTGGGAFNHFFIRSLQNHLLKSNDIELVVPAPTIIELKEGILMALLGVLRWNNYPTYLPSATGASAPGLGGVIYHTSNP